MDKLNSLKIIGNGMITNGDYGKISIIGEAIALEQIKCNYLKVVGNCTLKDEMISDRVKILGELLCENYVITNDELDILGNLRALNNYKVNKIKVTGEAKFEKSLLFEEVNVFGQLEVFKECEGNTFNSRGQVKIDGLLTAENIIINPNGISIINEIGGSKIIIKKKGIFSFGESRVISNLIEGDYIELENTECKIVRGHDITIASNCKIDKIEYTGSLSINKSSIVGEEVCLKN
ncbi:MULTISPECIES: hypothetical protein [unclassified Clostridium]|uniref:hypothetical protein n=1 Tax=unclassified Clostridium TaxID=2614128 RepID=UPI000297959F|nr:MULTISPECIES: hypothetical protein [unclassified Clostridium]EKQ56680.1 MAG: hypothetical protein A370_01755 [Clostridium sp. Maddingley MBC34-26]